MSVERRAASFEEHLATGPELDAPGDPIEQSLAELSLEPAIQLRERRLRDV
jgi:hypothetical protein